ncbi:hypothetical protein JHL18_17350 [Clostridium sp. YIM B02505]|uniref:Peptidase M1 membrane alanine aminopeptidase domain-containing protein n=1 Tax=Clostridium yunnanense TaxID=2800325 RepID=A0ABS1ESN2_9CLOT|nr:hypothetical protein [Clostridium yunnanense]MBK1812394.1 hypothetical protein [Clostridium yunnanense]
MAKKKKKLTKSNMASENKRIKSSYKIEIIVFLLCLLAGIVFYSIHNKPRKIELEYSIKTYSVDQKILNVNVKIKPRNAGTKKTFVLVKGSMYTSSEKCTDNLNREVNFKSENGIVVIDKLTSGADYINYSYNVNISSLGKHGENGQTYQDLLTFAGESVLALPLRALNYDDPKEDKIGKLTVQCSVPESWEAIIPYAKEGKKNISELKDPSWLQLYELRQATFTCGNFEKDIHVNLGKGYTVYIDPKAKQYYDLDAKTGIEGLYNYYSKLFDYKLDNYSIVLLRKDGEKSNYIIGGLCNQNLASTFDPKNKRDWQLLSHRLFHSFFESKVTSDKYLKAPYLGFYEGLATYYENMSMESLPENIRSSLDISSEKEIGYLFERYAYMRLKEPVNLALAPFSEVQLEQSPGRIEFLHYTQMPITINYMESLIKEKSGKKDNILNYILKNSSNNLLTVENITTNLLGKDSNDFIKKYLHGAEPLPLWSTITNRTESDKAIVGRLNSYEYDMYTWFSMENQLYQYDKIDETDLTKIAEEAEKQEVHFADKDTEEVVRSSGRTIYNLLKEYALRSKICNVQYNDPSLREKLLANQSNLEKWNTFKKNLK